MMEPAAASSSLDHHQEQQLGGGGASLAAPIPPHLDPGGRFQWNPGVFALDETCNHNPSSSNKVFSALRERQCGGGGGDDGILAPPVTTTTTSMARDLGHHWPYSSLETNSTAHGSHHFADVMTSSAKEIKQQPPPPPVPDSQLDREDHGGGGANPPVALLLPTSSQLREMSEKLLLKTLSPGYPLCAAGDQLLQSPPAAFLGGGAVFGRGVYSLVLPTANISPSSQLPFSDPCPRVSDFLQSSSRFSADEAFRQQQQPPGYSLRQDEAEELSNRSNRNKTSAVNGVKEGKRGGGGIPDANKAKQPPPQKRPRVEPRSSVPPLKVRKEKLGDRIAALQQLVAPFGKTDTASVLMEAIGYIKFLQDQVQTLSVPYLRSSNYNHHHHHASVQGGPNGGREEEPKLDLRSRGLCLVPLSCTSYVTPENVGIWPPPDHFRGGS